MGGRQRLAAMAARAAPRSAQPVGRRQMTQRRCTPSLRPRARPSHAASTPRGGPTFTSREAPPRCAAPQLTEGPVDRSAGQSCGAAGAATTPAVSPAPTARHRRCRCHRRRPCAARVAYTLCAHRKSAQAARAQRPLGGTRGSSDCSTRQPRAAVVNREDGRGVEATGGGCAHRGRVRQRGGRGRAPAPLPVLRARPQPPRPSRGA